jgi:hypothetical protein
MKIKAYSPLLKGEPIRTARLTTESSASPSGQPVLVIECVGPMEPKDLLLAEYRIVTATEEERKALAKAGYVDLSLSGDYPPRAK